MACDEFVLDLSEFLEASEPMWSSGGKEGKPGWMKEKGRFLCLVDGCRKKKLSFGQRYGLFRHWEEIHCQEITLFKCTRQASCRTFKRPYDLERHLVKIHNMNSDEAKAHSTSGAVKTKTVKNLHFVDPGRLLPPQRKASVPGTGKPLSETVPGVTVPAYPDLKRLKVNFPNERDCSEVEVVLPDKLSEGSGEPAVTAVIAETTSVSTVTNISPSSVQVVADMPGTPVSSVKDVLPLPESAETDMLLAPCPTIATSVTDNLPLPVSHVTADEAAMPISTSDELCIQETTKDSSTTSISVPQPQSRLVEGSLLNDQQRKKELISDILKSQDKIKFWTDKERKAKKELKELELKEQRIKERAMEKELAIERSKRKSLEVQIRKLQAKLDAKPINVLDSVDIGDFENFLNLGEVSFGDGLNVEE